MESSTTANIIASVAALVSALALIANAIMAYASKKSIDLLSRQLRSQSLHSIIDAHKDLYMSILSNDELCKLVADGHVEEYRRKQLGSILINHCSAIFSDYETELLDTNEFHEFVADAQGLFELSIVRTRWSEVRDFHSVAFRQFVDVKVLGGLDHWRGQSPSESVPSANA